MEIIAAYPIAIRSTFLMAGNSISHQVSPLDAESKAAASSNSGSIPQSAGYIKRTTSGIASKDCAIGVMSQLDRSGNIPEPNHNKYPRPRTTLETPNGIWKTNSPKRLKISEDL